MSLPFSSPCKDHDNCPLDIKALKNAIKNGSAESSAAFDRYMKACDKVKELIAQKAPEPAIKAAQSDQEKASRAYYDAAKECSAEGKTILYSIRAHHRGRPHRLKERQSDGTIVQHDLESQAAWLQDPSWNRILRRFLKQVPAVDKPTQAA